MSSVFGSEFLAFMDVLLRSLTTDRSIRPWIIFCFLQISLVQSDTEDVTTGSLALFGIRPQSGFRVQILILVLRTMNHCDRLTRVHLFRSRARTLFHALRSINWLTSKPNSIYRDGKPSWNLIQAPVRRCPTL